MAQRGGAHDAGDDSSVEVSPSGGRGAEAPSGALICDGVKEDAELVWGRVGATHAALGAVAAEVWGRIMPRTPDFEGTVVLVQLCNNGGADGPDAVSIERVAATAGLDTPGAKAVDWVIGDWVPKMLQVDTDLMHTSR